MSRESDLSNVPHVPIPAGAVAGDWDYWPTAGGGTNLDEAYRCLTWARHDVAGVRVSVGGAQYGDGRLDRHVLVVPDGGDAELSPAQARQLAAALLNAADDFEALP